MAFLQNAGHRVVVLGSHDQNAVGDAILEAANGSRDALCGLNISVI
jgi:hypothetical protein